MIRIIRSILFYSILLILFSCKSSSVEPNKLETYTPLALGDVTQLIYVKDSSTTMLTIVDVIRRTDGKIVYEAELKDGTQEPMKSYLLVSNGYLVGTLIKPFEDFTFMQIVNPYREQRLAKSNPNPGDTWFHSTGDPDSIYVIAEEIGAFTTFLGKIDNVYAFNFYHKNGLSPYLITYYAKNMGWIASSGFYFNPSETQFVCSYKKISGKTYGEIWPEKDFSNERLKVNFNPHLLSKLILDNRVMMISGELK